MRAGGEADLCVRLEKGGWTVDGRPGAVARDPGLSRVRPRLRALLREGAGSAWLRRRYAPEAPPGRARPRGLAARAALSLGRLGSNASEIPREERRPADVVI